MHYGVTGTRHGWNEKQRTEVIAFLKAQFKPGDILHHGDCEGVDVQVAAAAKEIGFYIVSHPPIPQGTRGHFQHNDEERPPGDYLDRDRDIVDDSDFMIVVPHQDQEVIRSGTWYTYRYSKKRLTPSLIVYPNNESVTNTF